MAGDLSTTLPVLYTSLPVSAAGFQFHDSCKVLTPRTLFSNFGDFNGRNRSQIRLL